MLTDPLGDLIARFLEEAAEHELDLSRVEWRESTPASRAATEEGLARLEAAFPYLRQPPTPPRPIT